MSLAGKPLATLPLVRWAVMLALGGLSCLSVFLWQDFSALSVGVGIVVGLPLTVSAIALYGIAVVRELRRRGEL
jgi:hypothetical protein